MTHRITAIIVDRSLNRREPVVVETMADDWKDAQDAVLTEYARLRGGVRNFDLDALELRAMAIIRTT